MAAKLAIAPGRSVADALRADYEARLALVRHPTERDRVSAYNNAVGAFLERATADEIAAIASAIARPRSARALRKAPTAADAVPSRTEKVASPYGHHHGFDRVRRVTDTISAMYRRSQLDARQKAAADAYQAAYLACPGAIPCALDQSRVAGGVPSSRSPTAAQLAAAERLAQTARVLGEIDGEVVRRIAGEGESIEEVASALAGKRASRREAEMVGMRLRMGLTVLADRWWPHDRSGIRAVRAEGSTPAGSKAGRIEPGRVAHATAQRVYGGGGNA